MSFTEYHSAVSTGPSHGPRDYCWAMVPSPAPPMFTHREPVAAAVTEIVSKGTMNDTKKEYEIEFSQVAIGALFRHEQTIYRKTTDRFATEQREDAGDAPLSVRFYPEERVTVWFDN